jgi:hypothetical protein
VSSDRDSLLNKALHPMIPSILHGNHIARVRSKAFSHSQGDERQ